MEYLTISEVCDLLRVTRKTLHTWSDEDKLPKYKIGGKVLYSADDVKTLIASSRV